MSWLNADGLYQKFGTEETVVVRGGEYNTGGHPEMVFEFKIAYTDALSATASILGTVTESGSAGVMIPKGMYIEEVEVITEAAFTSSGTIGSSTLVIGLVREDRSTTHDVDAFTSTSFVGGAFDAAGEKTVLRIGSTGVGSAVGTVLAHDGLVIVANSAHASHPFTAGRAIVRVKGYMPQ